LFVVASTCCKVALVHLPAAAAGFNPSTWKRENATETVTFHKSEARGRNGWFRMASASLYAARGRINVDFVSKRAVCPGPVCLELSPEDATALAQAMLSQVQTAQPRPASNSRPVRSKSLCQRSPRQQKTENPRRALTAKQGAAP